MSSNKSTDKNYIFKDNAKAYWDKGFSAIPIDPKTKKGGYGWNEFNKRIPNTEEQQRMLKSKPDFGLGIVCGPQNLVAIDFDYDQDDWEEIERVIKNIIPPSPVGKKGRKGWTYFYRFDSKLITKNINRKGEVVSEKTGEVKTKNFRVMDIIDNRITVMPPTVHPNTKLPYVWLTEKTLLDINVDDLPLYTEEMSRKIKELVSNPDTLLNTPKTKNSKADGGRHDNLYLFFRTNVEKAYDFNNLKEMIVEFDIKNHTTNPKGPMFQDYNMYSAKGSPEAFIDYEITRWFKHFEKDYYQKNRKTFSFRGNFSKTVDKSEADLASKYPSYHDGFHFASEKGMIPSYYELANYIHEKYELYYTDAAGYVWNGKYYESIKDLEIKNKIVLACKNNLDPKNLDQAFKIIKALNPRSIKEPQSGLLNLNNGVLNLFTKELKPHSKEICFTYINKIDYDPKAKCKKWLNFLDVVLQNDKELLDLVQEMFGYTIIGGAPFLHKSFILQGEGRNGKSTLLEVLKALLGRDNYTSVPLQQLDKPFSAMLVNKKLANILGELTTKVINNEYFKTVVGGEPIVMSNKGKDEFLGSINARFIFATNKIPNFGDTTTGIYERLCFIPFDTYIAPDKRDPFIVEKLLAELPGILNWAIEGALRVFKAKRLTHSHRSDLLMNAWRNDTDSVLRFISDELLITCNESHFLYTDVLHIKYTNMCVSDGVKAFGKPAFMKKFYENLRKIFPNFDFKTANSREKYVRGVQFVSAQNLIHECPSCKKVIVPTVKSDEKTIIVKGSVIH